MNIGEFKNVKGQLLGSIATREIDLPRLGLRPVDSNSDRAPAFEIVALNPGKRWVQVGALWEATSNATGESFYQGRIDDPSLAAPLPVALFGNDEEGFRVVWTRSRPNNRDGFGTSQRGGRRQQADDGFGEGNATDQGTLAQQPADLDEAIPF